MKRLSTLLICLIMVFAFYGCDSSLPGFDDDGNDVADDDKGNDDDAPGSGTCEPVAPAPWPEPDLADPSVISFDNDLYFTVDSQRFFPLGFYGVDQDAESLAKFKSEGFNLALTGPGCCGSGTEAQVDFLRLAQEQGLMIILRPWSSRSDVLNLPEEVLAQDLADRTAVGSLFGWYTFDEPALHRPSKELTERTHYILSTYAPNHPGGLVEQTMDYFELYVDDCGFFMIDPYPSPHLYLSMVKESVIEANRATLGLKPTVGVMQAFSWAWIEDNFEAPFHPTAHEVRSMMWQFIIFGARGLVPWKYDGDFTLQAVPEIWSAFLEDVAEVNELMRVILADDLRIDLNAEATRPTQFDYIVKEEETATWVLSVSTNEHPSLVSLDLSLIGSDLCVVDYTTGETFEQDDAGRIQVKYDEYQIRILEVR